jgi:arylsulfatase A-like enzyme
MARPNIVLITAHDLGQHLGCYGRRGVPSPHLDALAKQGVLFEWSFCTAPQCSPSRSALHTGRHAHSNGMLGLAHDTFAWRMHPGEKHMAQRLREAGYATALFGVQHLVSREEAPTLGYDSLYPLKPAAELSAAAAAWLAEPHAQPFYLEVGFFEPHRPYDYGGVKPTRASGVFMPPYIPETPEAQAEFAALQGAIGALDAGVGVILQALDDQHLTDNTWVIFVTDHGIAMPRAKCTCYEPGIETALIMRWPNGGVNGGRRCGELVSHVDLVPTMLDALALDIPAHLHGRSYWPLLQGAADYVPNHEIYAEKTFHTAYEPMRCIRTATYKLIVNLDQDIAVNVPSDIRHSPIYPQMLHQITPHRPYVELYDLVADPKEQHNLSGDAKMADIERDLKQRLLAWMEATDDPILQGPVPSPYYRAALTRLRA